VSTWVCIHAGVARDIETDAAARLARRRRRFHQLSDHADYLDKLPIVLA
jgi:hypothetical protein